MSASVPLPTATAWRAQTAAATSSSRARTLGPRMKRPESITSHTARFTSSRRCSYWPRMSIRGTGILDTLDGRPAPPAQKPAGCDGDRDGHDDVVQEAQTPMPGVPVGAGDVADRDEEGAPRQAAQERQEREAAERHPGDAGGERDERADHGQEAREEDDRRAVTLEPAVRLVDVAAGPLGAKQVRVHAVHPRRPGDPRADQVRGVAEGEEEDAQPQRSGRRRSAGATAPP